MEVFKSLLPDWLDWMTGSEKYSNRVTYIKYKLPQLTLWVEAVMRNITHTCNSITHTALTCVLPQPGQTSEDPGGATTTQLVLVSMGGNTSTSTSTSTVFVMQQLLDPARRSFQLT